jgi:NADH:ubiquinone oxidoreductase subunit 6 (subunit J)
MPVILSVAFLVCMGAAIWRLPPSYNSFGDLPAAMETGLTRMDEAGATQPRLVEFGSTEGLSYTIFEGFPLAFEVVSLLIFAAVLGAVLLARRHLVAGALPAKEGDHA